MNPCILIVDDKKEFLKKQKNILINDYGFRTRYTTKLDGIERVIDSTEINCIHLDLILDPTANEPDWEKPTGLSVISRIILERNLNIPIMILSGYIDDHARQLAKDYGIGHLIVKWYHKAVVDYDKVVLDTIKVINEREFNRTKDLMLDFARASGDENYRLFETALTTIPVVKHDIKLNPTRLLDALESLSWKLIELFEESDEKKSQKLFEKKFKGYVMNFKEIVNEHICDYFRNSTDYHRILAGYFVDAIAEVDEKNETLKTKAAWELMQDIIDLFGKETLSDDEIYNARIKMEDMLGVSIGLRFPESEKLDKYVELTMKRG